MVSVTLSSARFASILLSSKIVLFYSHVCPLQSVPLYFCPLKGVLHFLTSALLLNVQGGPLYFCPLKMYS
jgi:hypothetical protein